MNKLSLSISIALLLNSQAFATIHMVASDPVTRSVGMVSLSSGPIVTYVPRPTNGVKGVGFVSWSGDARNVSPAMDKKVFEMMRNASPPEQIAHFVDSQIHDKYSRYLFISAQTGLMNYVFPPRGCAQPDCGVQFGSTKQFLIMGGGLEKDVVAKAAEIYEKIHAVAQLPFVCKLLAGMQTIINVGGELKEFAEASIALDQPGRAEQDWFSTVDVREARMTENFRDQILKKGVHCPALRQVRLKQKTRNFGQSFDLK